MIRPSLLALPIILYVTLPVFAQQNRRPERTPNPDAAENERRPTDRTRSQRGGGNFRNAGQLPKIGAMLPSLKVVDEQGKVFSTDTLRGSYTVLVFGCLT